MAPLELEREFRELMLRSGMACLIPDKDIIMRGDGQLLLSGAFCVHEGTERRLIMDMRPANGGEHRVQWAALPYGPALSRLHVPWGHCIRGSGDT